MRACWSSVKALLVLTLLTGVVYPLVVTALATLVFPVEAGGSLLRRDGVVVGSRWLAQKVEDPRYFWFRPSAADYATVPSGASNLSPASRRFVEAVRARRASFGPDAPADLLTTSASGLDPHVSLEGALFQVERIALRRGLGPEGEEQLRNLVRENVEERTFGILGQNRVNVSALNLALDEAFPKR